MVGRHLRQDVRGVAQDAGQRIVEIHGHRARELEGAQELLLQGHRAARFRLGGCGRRGRRDRAPAGVVSRERNGSGRS
jgi:hypothetical protein